VSDQRPLPGTGRLGGRANDVRRRASWVQRCERTADWTRSKVQTHVRTRYTVPSGGRSFTSLAGLPRPRRFAPRCRGRASHHWPARSFPGIGTLSTSALLASCCSSPSCSVAVHRNRTGRVEKISAKPSADYISRQAPVVASCSSER
jgi:hypothetical protein